MPDPLEPTPGPVEPTPVAVEPGLAPVPAADIPPEAWSGVHRGPLRAGEWVRLTDQKGRRHNICLEPGKTFHTNRGGMKEFGERAVEHHSDQGEDQRGGA